MGSLHASSSSSSSSSSSVPSFGLAFSLPRTPLSDRPRSSPQVRGLNSDVFKPRLPHDPFTVLPKQPIQVSAESIFTLSAAQPSRNVILAIGAPSHDHLAPLLRSEQLAASLLIVASHDPPAFPSFTQPAVRVLRLNAPLDLERDGAIALVNILEWAERVARTWRKYGGTGVQFIDEHDTGALSPPAAFRSRANSSASIRSSVSASKSQPASPHHSQVFLPNSHVNSSSTSNLVSQRQLRKRQSRALPKVDPSQRPFDALLHCIGSQLPDKLILKQSILVTTVSRTFLVAAAPPPPSPPSSSSLQARRGSFLRRSVTSLYMTPSSSRDSLLGMPNASGKAHLVHLLCTTARASPRVLASVESFLLSFQPTPSPVTELGGMRHTPESMKAARTFVLDARTFGTPLPVPPALGIPPDFSLADAILGGCVDATLAQDQPTRPRAWITSTADIHVVITPGVPDAPPQAHVLPNGRTPRGMGLPTPPDSEEDNLSVGDGAYASDVERRMTLGKRGAVAEPLTLGRSRGQERLAPVGVPLSAPPTLNGPPSTLRSRGQVLVKSEGLSPGTKRRRWMFWRRGD
ncbi:hypothetical protein K488DRAFT_73228 [Vararia minispora EC-137]|uniref:Uncharacterized protein n=1 Tax=Vararia minispora EC-137 TaxID=1314806 RepID=A0ACB8QCW1_9AGAM|nr:hypothetical protein K488DRAFT_73228 [Vararia minispora EC-137]